MSRAAGRLPGMFSRATRHDGFAANIAKLLDLLQR